MSNPSTPLQNSPIPINKLPTAAVPAKPTFDVARWEKVCCGGDV